MNEIMEQLKKIFKLNELNKEREDLYFITAEKEQLVSLLTHLRDIHQFTSLIFLQAVDYIEDNLFQLTYMTHNYEKHISLGIRVKIDRQAAEMSSIHHLWEHAETFQRELKELFGIDFPGSPDIDSGFVLEGWEDIPPMRKDFDTAKYAEKTFFPRSGRKTHDPAEYMKNKLYPESN
jgi:NADH-quinone oxidoreductase subunit C